MMPRACQGVTAHGDTVVKRRIDDTRKSCKSYRGCKMNPSKFGSNIHLSSSMEVGEKTNAQVSMICFGKHQSKYYG